MKKHIGIIFSILIFICVIALCLLINYFGAKNEKEPANVDMQNSLSTEVQNQRIVMIDGKLYYDTGEVSNKLRCGNVDGEITSTVEENKIPTENNQSNFGTGFGYQYWSDTTVEIRINKEWIIFEQQD